MDRSKLKQIMGEATVDTLNTGIQPVKNNNVNVDTQDIIIRGGIRPSTSVKDHSALSNLDYFKSGHTGFAGIQFGTTAEWNAQLGYIPVQGMLVVYTDFSSYEDAETGEIHYIPGFKIGDGNAYLIDKPFLSDDIRMTLINHINNGTIHITAEERDTWNNKLNYEEVVDDLLEFTRN